METSPVAAPTLTTPPRPEVLCPELDSIALQFLPFELPPRLEPPSTPIHRIEGHIQNFTPPRSRKSFVPRVCPPTSPVLLSFSPNHSPLSLANKRSNGGSASKQHTSKDKENVPLTSMFDRTQYGSPASRKRALPDEAGAWNTPKKHKGDTGPFAFDSIRIPLIFNYFHHAAVTPMTPNNSGSPVTGIPSQLEDIFITENRASSSTSEVQVSSPCTSRKRKRVLLDCVEVPTLRQVRWQQRRAASFQSVVTPPIRTLRRTRSATRSRSGATLFESPEDQYGRPLKRRCEAKSDTIDDAILVSLREATVAGSGESGISPIFIVFPTQSYR